MRYRIRFHAPLSRSLHRSEVSGATLQHQHSRAGSTQPALFGGCRRSDALRIELYASSPTTTEAAAWMKVALPSAVPRRIRIRTMRPRFPVITQFFLGGDAFPRSVVLPLSPMPELQDTDSVAFTTTEAAASTQRSASFPVAEAMGSRQFLCPGLSLQPTRQVPSRARPLSTMTRRPRFPVGGPARICAFALAHQVVRFSSDRSHTRLARDASDQRLQLTYLVFKDEPTITPTAHTSVRPVPLSPRRSFVFPVPCRQCPGGLPLPRNPEATVTGSPCAFRLRRAFRHEVRRHFKGCASCAPPSSDP